MPKKTDKAPIIILGADHGGFQLKQTIKKHFFDKEVYIEDISPQKVPGDDYPDHAKRIANLIKKKRNSIGILFCKTGTGMVIAANKVPGIRAAFAHNEHVVKMARKDENANILCFPNTTKPTTAIKQINTFLKTNFTAAPRHKRRIKKLSKM